ncbi:MAG: TlyA family RNA methyltransferase [Clostridia bacterium]|nr:TlyA family RNA methyltransferase [Clostridia bacterium]
MNERIDILLFDKGLAKSREKARALIMAGVVYADGVRVDKAGTTVDENATIEVREDPVPFVSRGGLKLQKSTEVFPIDLTGKVCADIGSSTGGFTDCMLQHGASKVYAVDVGYGQLDWSLRTDPRVAVMERMNARYMEPSWYEPAPAFASIDVSFISLTKILPPLFTCLTEGGEVVALVKPQFEAGRGEVGKNGVVREPDTHRKVCERIVGEAASYGYSVMGLDYSPITGPKGNIEFLLWLRKPETGEERTDKVSAERIKEVVAAAHSSHIK